MKRLAALLCAALACVGISKAAFRGAPQQEERISSFVPAGPLVYLEARDFSALLREWNSSKQKEEWLRSGNYQTFSRSRLFMRLEEAGSQFAVAAGLSPTMDFLSDVAGERSAVAVYDIGKLQFLYVTYLPSARSAQSILWQTRSKFETRTAGGTEFYLRRDTESQREFAFAISGGYLLLATREDLIAGALQLLAGKAAPSVENDQWFAQATSATEQIGDLRLVLNMQSLVPNGYFRTYWVQQNITDLGQYSAAVSDLFRSANDYREERVLIRKKEADRLASSEATAAVADLSRLIPDRAGFFETVADPSADANLALLQTKLLMSRSNSAVASKFAPQVQLTSGEQGSGSDFETRIDATTPAPQVDSQANPELKALFAKTPVLASLQLQSTTKDAGGVFVGIHSAVVFKAASVWNPSEVQTAFTDSVKTTLTASQLSVRWQQKSGYQQLDGLFPLTLAVNGQYVAVSDDPSLIQQVLAKLSTKTDCAPLALYAGFSHSQERGNFLQMARLIDRATGAPQNANATGYQPQFFSGNIASLSATLSDVEAERIEVRSDAQKIRQTVTYQWSH
jgi:hypothetical protein